MVGWDVSQVISRRNANHNHYKYSEGEGHGLKLCYPTW